VIKFWGKVVELCVVFFFSFGIKHNKNIHNEEWKGTGILSELIIVALLVEGLLKPL
jgi:hypothetical protein